MHGHPIGSVCQWLLTSVEPVGETEPWQSACSAFPILLPSSPRIHQPRPLLEMGSCLAEEEISSIFLWTLASCLFTQEMRRPQACGAGNWGRNKGYHKDRIEWSKITTLLFGSLPEAVNISLKVCSKKLKLFLLALQHKPRSYRARLELVELAGRRSARSGTQNTANEHRGLVLG